MACKGCAKRKAKIVDIVRRLGKAVGIDTVQLPGTPQFTIVCTCGLTRCLPEGVQLGDSIDLAPCPRCGSDFKGTFVGSHVELQS